jgi:hypothetical protein
LPSRASTLLDNYRRKDNVTLTSVPDVSLVSDGTEGVDSAELAQLLSDVRDVLGRFIVMKDEQLDTVALWTAHTYVFREFFVTPYLAVMSPTKQSGKTNLLTILEALCYEPLVIVHSSTAALYNSIDQLRPTMLFDEQDMAKLSKTYQGILHSGYKQGAHVIVQQRGKPTRLNVYCPKVFASIGRVLSSTLMDRVIQIHMVRKTKADTVEELDLESLARATEGLPDRLANFRADFLRASDGPEMPETLTSRERELWRPLFHIASQADGWSSRVWDACVQLSGEAHNEEVDPSVLMLADIRTAFAANKRLFSTELVKRMVNLDDPQYEGPATQSQKHLANALAPYRIRPHQIRMGRETKKGYDLTDFAEAFRIYLPE